MKIAFICMTLRVGDDESQSQQNISTNQSLKVLPSLGNSCKSKYEYQSQYFY